jgi:signal transduction histidine kinase
MSPRTQNEPSAVLRVALPVAVMVGAMLLSPIGDVRVGGVTTPLAFGQTRQLPTLLDLVAGQALLLAGTMAWLMGPRARVGTLAVLAGICWFGPDLFALVGADPLVRAVGRFILVPFLLPLLLHLIVAALGMDDRRGVRAALALMYLAAFMVAIGGAATYDVYYDANCLDCRWQNPLLLASGPGAVRIWRTAGAALALAIAVGGAVAGAGWLVRSRTRTAARITIAASMLGLTVAAGFRGVLLLAAPRADTSDVRWAAAWFALVTTALVLGLGVGGLAIETWRRASRMKRIAESLEAAPAPGTLEAAVARAAGDPTLRIAYCLDDGRLVDPGGAAIDLPQGPSATITPVERDAERLAIIAHRSGVDPSGLALAFGPTVLVALDNERLRAARLARLAELRASRSRIVAVGDAERRRLERDLHDGVQQQLLAFLFDVRLARLTAEQTGDPARASELGETETRTQAIVEEVRRLAHGIHPAVLSRSGLVPALTSLAEVATIPVELEAGVVERLPEAVEAAAYRFVAEALADAEATGASELSVAVAPPAGGRLRIEIRDTAAGDVVGSPIVPVRIADRVGAAGGDVTAEALAGGGTLLRVELPCG